MNRSCCYLTRRKRHVLLESGHAAARAQAVSTDLTSTCVRFENGVTRTIRLPPVKRRNLSGFKRDLM